MFDFQGMKDCIEHSDAERLASYYTQDAELQVIDRDRPPAAPMTLRGRQAIAEFWRDVCGRQMTHHVENEVVGNGRVSFLEECEYPDGCKVMSANVLDLADGKILRHVTVQAWDEAPGATQH
jgi:hypothetical protein